MEIEEKDAKLREVVDERDKRAKTKEIAGDRMGRLVSVLKKQVHVERSLKDEALKQLMSAPRASDSESDTGDEARSVAFSTTRPSTTKSYKSTFPFPFLLPFLLSEGKGTKEESNNTYQTNICTYLFPLLHVSYLFRLHFFNFLANFLALLFFILINAFFVTFYLAIFLHFQRKTTRLLMATMCRLEVPSGHWSPE